MQRDISTNIRLPEEVWRSIKVKAAQEGRSMKDIILEGVALILRREKTLPIQHPKQNLLLEFSGKVAVDLPKGSIDHDRYLYEK